MLNKRALFIFLGLILFIWISNIIISNMLSQEILKRKGPSSLRIETEKPTQTTFPKRERKKYALIPEDPAKYGMISYSKTDQPRTQLQWDVFMEKALIKSKALESDEAKKSLAKMKKSPEEFQARLQEVDQRIELFKTRLEKDPSDKEAEKRLQILYMLKSLGKTLEEKVTSH